MDSTSSLVTVTTIVSLAAILLAFSQEFIRFTKKITSKPLICLLLSLLFFSCLVENYVQWIRNFLFVCGYELHLMIIKMAKILPFKTGSLHLISILLLFILACFPAWVFWLKVKIKDKGLFELPVFGFYLGAVLWIVGVFMWIFWP